MSKTQIENKIYNFFIENLAYCALNKRKGIDLYADLNNKDQLFEVIDWIEHILKRKFFYEKVELPKVIYFYFPDKKTVENLNEIFENITFEQYKDYFNFCKDRIYSYNEDNLELFSFINFFHLIGTLRFFNNSIDEPKIVEILNELIFNIDNHPLIRYSAMQIKTNVEIKDNKKPIYTKNITFKKRYIELLQLLEENNQLVKYISFYSMYYYNNDFNHKQLIEDKYFKRITENNTINFKNLHTFIPQIASQLIRLDKDIYKNKIKTELIDLFYIEEKTDVNKINNLKNKIISLYAF